MGNSGVEYKLPKVHLGAKSTRTYAGLLEKADLRLHSQIAQVIAGQVPVGSRILDMGAGQGALSKRLADLGMQVLAVDMDAAGFKATDVPFQPLNFDQPAEVEAFISAHRASFDVVLGIEVIEHVENQWSYVRQLHNLLKPGGLMLITTPNTTSWLSRILFLFSGRFHQFADEDLSYGHISPITPWELGVLLSRTGYEDVRLRPAGTLPPLYLSGFNAVSALSLLLLPLRPLLRGLLDGWCVMATARRKE